jgi:hypothetical protein
VLAKLLTVDADDVGLNATTLQGLAPADLAGQGVPAGGADGQVLAKASAEDYDAHWVDPPSGGGGDGGDVDLSNVYTKAQVDYLIGQELSFAYIPDVGVSSAPIALLRNGETVFVRAGITVADWISDEVIETVEEETEYTATKDVRIYLNEPLLHNGSWIRRGGIGGPVPIGAILPTVWNDDVVKKNGETWLKLNGQALDPEAYPLLGDQMAGTFMPAMTSATTPEPYKVYASSSNGEHVSAWRMFDKRNNDDYNYFWHAGGGAQAGRAVIDLGDPVRVIRYKIFNRATENNVRNGFPRNWFFQGSNTTIDVSESDEGWDTLDTRTDQSTTGLDWHDYTIANPGYYRYYRIKVLNTNGYILIIGEMQLLAVGWLSDYGTNEQGHNYYVKAAGYTNNGYTIEDGVAPGQVLAWDGSHWVPTDIATLLGG